MTFEEGGVFKGAVSTKSVSQCCCVVLDTDLVLFHAVEVTGGSTRTRVVTHAGGVDRLGVVIDHPRQAEVRHLTDEVAVDEDVACSQISMNVSHV